MVSIFILLLPFILYIFHYYFTFCFLVFQICDWRLIYELFFFFDIRNLGFTFSLITQGLAQVLIEVRNWCIQVLEWHQLHSIVWRKAFLNRKYWRKRYKRCHWILLCYSLNLSECCGIYFLFLLFYTLKSGPQAFFETAINPKTQSPLHQMSRTRCDHPIRFGHLIR